VKYFFSVLLLLNAINSHGEIIEAVPTKVMCILSGTGFGTCDIYFPSGTTNTCTKPNLVAFDPSGALGTEVYNMVMMAATASITLKVALLPCNGSGKPEIDNITYKS
jgi:hypothetical protein